MRRYQPSRWFNKGVTPEKLSDHTLEHDRWDDEDLERMLEELATFSAARKTLSEFVDTGEPAMGDTFWSFLKVEPEVLDPSKVRPSHLVNHRVIQEMHGLDEFERLRRYSVNDDVQAALSSVTIEPDLETLFDRLKKQREQAKEYEQALQQLAQAITDLDDAERDLDEMVKRWSGQDDKQDDQDGQSDQGDQGQGQGQDQDQGQGEGQDQSDQAQAGQGDGQGDTGAEGKADGPGTGPDTQSAGGVPGSGAPITEEQRQQLAEAQHRRDDAQSKADEARENAEKLGQELGDSLDNVQASMRHHLKGALDKAANDAQETQETARAWGLEPGELQRKPAPERIELAKRLNNDRFRRIADLFGPMRNLMLSEQQRKVIHAKEEVYDVGIGNDLSRVLPQELINLREGPSRRDFLRRFSEGKLLQYEMQGTDKLSRGGIILCEDGSGSMHGERELWAKAVMLCLLHLARQQKRSFHLIHFGSPRQYKLISFTTPGDFTLNKVLDAAELFFGGGTDFETPMQVTLDLLRAEFDSTGAVRGDCVFVTDDECGVRDAFMKEYLAESDRMSFTTWGISVSGGKRGKGPLMDMSQGKVATIKDFLTGSDIRHIFRGL